MENPLHFLLSECNLKSCSDQIIQADYGSLPLLEFNRKFTWNLNVSAAKAFKIDFTKTGLRQINSSEVCPDRHSYTIQAFQAGGNVAVGKYCRTGMISSAQILNAGSFSLEVPAGQKLQNGQFDVSVGEEIKCEFKFLCFSCFLNFKFILFDNFFIFSLIALAKITLTFPKGTFSTDLLSPNYPDSFPNDDRMEWYFQVPEKHRTSVQFLNLTQPQCLRNETSVEVSSRGRVELVYSLMDPLQNQNWANASLMLRNCEMDRKRSGSPGLSVNLKVSTSNTSSPGLYIICLFFKHFKVVLLYWDAVFILNISHRCAIWWSDKPWIWETFVLPTFYLWIKIRFSLISDLK